MTGSLVLVIDGGGVKGLYSLRMIRRIMHSRCLFRPDLIVSVSVGALIGALVATGKLELFDDVFITHLAQSVLLDTDPTQSGLPWLAPKYRGKMKRRALETMFGNMLFNEVTIPMSILLDRIDGPPVVCNSWENDAFGRCRIVDLLDATSAVPTMFPPVSIRGIPYTDGGTISASPLCIAYLVACTYFPNHDDIWMLSVGTRDNKTSVPQTRSFDNLNMGIVQLLALGVPMKVVTQRTYVSNQLVRTILKDRFMRIDSFLDVRFNSLDGVTEIFQAADTMWSTIYTDVQSFIKRCHPY
tara:strand:+ start:2969 stop:3862 length:894 start_codon:yes stop_codon:yes gene_type:complete